LPVPFVVTPVLSQAANGQRAGSTHPKRANPHGRQELRESARSASYGTLRAINPDPAIPLISYKSELHDR